MKILIPALTAGVALAALAMPTFAQQIPPVADVKAAIACAPADMAAAVACLEKHLKPEVKADITAAANPDALMPQEIYVGLWMRNNWGFWTGSPVAQYMLAKRVTQPEAQTNRIIQAYWLKAKGCSFDYNNVGYVVAGMRKLGQGADPCSVTLAEADTAARNPMGVSAAQANNRTGAAARAAAAAAAAAEESDDADINPNQ